MVAYIQTQMDESDWACGILSRVLSDKAKQQIIVEIYNAEGEFIRSTIDRKVTINNCVYQLHTNSMDEITTLLQGAIGGAMGNNI